jgi:hypothetical protein
MNTFIFLTNFEYFIYLLVDWFLSWFQSIRDFGVDQFDSGSGSANLDHS